MQDKFVGLVGKKNKKRELMKDGINYFFSKTNNYHSPFDEIFPVGYFKSKMLGNSLLNFM